MQVEKLTDKEKETRIRLIELEIEKITQKFQDPSDPIHKLYSTKSPKKDLIKDWAGYLEQLHALGKYKEPVYTISSTIKKELTKMGLTEAVHYVHEVLQFKYKQENKMNYNSDEIKLSGSTTQNSSENFLIENETFIHNLKDVIKFIEFVIDFLKKNNFSSKLDQNELEEYFLVQTNATLRGYLIFNNKKKDMEQGQALLLEAITLGNSDYAAGMYMSKLKQLDDMTGKQAVKILRGLATNLHPLYDPKNRVEAMKYGFQGQECEECGSFRVGFIYEDATISNSKRRCYCYKCKTWQDPITILAKEVLDE